MAFFVRLSRPSHFSLFRQREVTKRKTTRVARPSLRYGFASGWRGLSTARPCPDDKLAPIHGRAPAGLSASPPPLHTGPESKCEIKIKLDPSLRWDDGKGGAQCASEVAAAAAAAAAAASAAATAPASARWSARSLMGPLRRGEAGTIGPQGRAQEVRAFVVRTWTCCRQTPAPTHAPFGQGCPKGAAPGWPSLWLLSLGHSRERDSGARRRSKKAMDGARVLKRTQTPRSKWIPASTRMTSKTGQV